MAEQQFEIEGTESPDRDPELHALWLEICELEEDVKAARGRLKTKREEAGAALKKRGLSEYFIDGAELWIEPAEKVKAHKKGARPKGKVKKVTSGPAEWGPDDDGGEE